MRVVALIKNELVIMTQNKKLNIYETKRNLTLSLLLIVMLCISWFLIYPYAKQFSIFIFIILMFVFSWMLKKADKTYNKGRK